MMNVKNARLLARRFSKVLLLCLLLFQSKHLFAQQDRQSDTSVNRNVPLIKADKIDLLNNIQVIANSQVALNSDWNDGHYQRSRFAVNQFRLEIKGNVFGNKVYFRFRDRYTRDPETQSVDNLSRSTDIAFIGYNISDKASVSIGKMTANWGGYEFDLNPIDVYQYNDIMDNSDNFLTGVQFNYALSKSHTVSAQILNSRTKTFAELYHDIEGVTEAKFPAAYVGTWNGSFLDRKLQTHWSFSIFQEASRSGRPVNMYYTALGNQFSSRKWLLQYDFKLSNQDLDRTGLVSSFVAQEASASAVQNVYYKEHWLRAVYSLNEQIKLTASSFISTSHWKDDATRAYGSSRVRTTLGIVPSVEWYPIKNYNLKFFAAYAARFYRYSDYAKQELTRADNSLSKCMIGIASPLQIL